MYCKGYTKPQAITQKYIKEYAPASQSCLMPQWPRSFANAQDDTQGENVINNLLQRIYFYKAPITPSCHSEESATKNLLPSCNFWATY